MMRLTCFALALASVLMPAVARAQPAGPASPAARQAAPQVADDAAALGRAWTALAAGRPDDALKTADEILRRAPWSHAALTVRLYALAAGSGPRAALDAYEAWLEGAPGRTEDLPLLDPVVVGILWEAARSADPGLASLALERLARGGASGAREALAKAGPAADAVLATLGNEAALGRLKTADSPVARRRYVEALEAGGSNNVPALLALLDDADAGIAGDAAAALGRLGATQAAPRLRESLRAEYPHTRHVAAVALARLGDPEGQAEVARMLTTDIADVQLMAASAWNGRPGPWVDAVLPLLGDQTGLVRLEAARLLLTVRPEEAQPVLVQALGDANPAVRFETARVLERLDPAVAARLAPELRARLRDPDAAVRSLAASVIVRLIRPENRRHDG